MSKTSHNLIRRVERRLDRYVGMEQSHCGHEGPALEAKYERQRFLDWLQVELEKYANTVACERDALNRGPG